MSTLAAVVTTTTTFPGFPSGGSLPDCTTAAQCLSSGSGQIVEGGGSGMSVSSSSGLAIGSFAGTLVEILAIASMAALVGIIIIAVVANRADPDPTGRRPQSVYYFVVSFVAITTAIVGSALFVASLLWLTAHHSSSTDHAVDRLMLVSALIFLVGTGLLVSHLRRGLALARAEGTPAGPSHRIGQSYVSIVAFVSILVLLVIGVFTIYLLFAIASPATFGSFGGRSDSVRILLESVYLDAVAIIVLWTHGSLLTPRLGLFRRGHSDPTVPPGGESSIPLPPV